MGLVESDFTPQKKFMSGGVFEIVDWNNDGFLDVIMQTDEDELTIMIHTDEGLYVPQYSITLDDSIQDFEIMNANADEFVDLVIATKSVLDENTPYAKLHIYEQNTLNGEPILSENPNSIPFYIGNDFSTELQVGDFSAFELDDIGVTSANGEVTTNYLFAYDSETNTYNQKYGFLSFRLNGNIDLVNTGSYIYDDLGSISRFNSSLNNDTLDFFYYVESEIEPETYGAVVLENDSASANPVLFETVNKVITGNVLNNDNADEFIVLSNDGNLLVDKSGNYNRFFRVEDINIDAGGTDAKIVDIDNDGDNDIIIAGMGDNNELIQIYKNNGSDSYSLEKTIVANPEISSLKIVDEDNNGLLDLIIGSNDGNSYIVNQFENIWTISLPVFLR